MTAGTCMAGSAAISSANVRRACNSSAGDKGLKRLSNDSFSFACRFSRVIELPYIHIIVSPLQCIGGLLWRSSVQMPALLKSEITVTAWLMSIINRLYSLQPQLFYMVLHGLEHFWRVPQPVADFADDFQWLAAAV